VSDPSAGAPALSEPRIYYGENAPGYAIVKSDQAELDYQKPDGTNVNSKYAGTGGVPVGSFFRRLAFALHFGDQNFVISGQIKSNSRAIYVRDIGARVRKAAPFLRYDTDPYSVILGNRVLWVYDAYTVTSRYPYSQRANTERIDSSSGLNTSFNYVRNSVKVVIDAYDGSMTFYVMDDTDPIVKTYEKAFPKLFTPGKNMSPDLQAHLRYPEDLFRVQTNMYGRYHITDPNGFYTQADAWSISQDPGSGSPSATVQQTQTTTANGLAGPSRQRRMDPTYLLMRLPGDQTESFLILQPFVPVSPSDKQQNLTAFMTAKSDPGNYGKLQAFVMPRGEQIDGPALINSTINATSDISPQISLLNQQGSRVQLGNVLVLPIEKSILYVRPLYVSSDQNPLPELRKVIVVNGDRAIMRDSLADALNALVPGANVSTLEQQQATATPGTNPPPGPNVNATVQQLLDQAAQDFSDAEAALKNGDLATYQQKIKAAESLVDQARQKGSSTTSTTQASA
jgi:uncharacterized protein